MKKLNILAFVILVLSISSCQRKYTWVYTNQTPTFFKKQHDFEVGGSFSSLAQGHVAYAITDNISLKASAAIGQRDTIEYYEPGTINTAGFQVKEIPFYTDVEFSAGYFKRLQSDWILETYAGFAWVNARDRVLKINDLTGEEVESSNPNQRQYQRFFIQPAIGKTGKIMDYGAGIRFSMIHYEDQVTDVMAEPMVFGRWGYQYLKFMTQASLRINSMYGSHEYRIWPVSFGVGINFVFHRPENKK
jgi:hypothetical protein